MTEAEWLTCDDPMVMVQFLRGNLTGNDTATQRTSDWRFGGADKGNDRKFRLFACACCRRIWHHIPAQCNRDAVVAIEDFLDGHLSAQALQEAVIASSAVEGKEGCSGKQSESAYWTVKYLGRGFYKLTAAENAIAVAVKVMLMADGEYGREAERVAQAAIHRCLFGNPCLPVTLDRSWLAWNECTVGKIAQGIHDDRAFGDLPILADALEEAGCSNGDILAHCRGPGPHVRGCWVVDLLLGKE